MQVIENRSAKKLFSLDSSRNGVNYKIEVWTQQPILRSVIFVTEHVGYRDAAKSDAYMINESHVLQLALPHMVFIFSTPKMTTGGLSHSRDVRVGFCEKEPGLEEKIYFQLLPNVYHDDGESMLKVCMVARSREPGDVAIDAFWHSKFRMYSHNLTSSQHWSAPILLKSTPLRSYARWSQLSVEGRIDICNLDAIYRKSTAWKGQLGNFIKAEFGDYKNAAKTV